MGIFDSFLKPATPATPEQAAITPGQQQAPSNQGNIPENPTVVSEPNNPNAPVKQADNAQVSAEPETPLDGLEDLWHTDSNKKSDDPVQLAELKAEDVQKVVANIDFARNITPETLTAITAGGEDATKAFMTAMNQMSRDVLTQSMMVNTKLTEKAVADALKNSEGKLPQLLRDQSASEHLRTSNPVFDNPAVKPIISAVQKQFLDKFPNETNTQITERVNKAILAMGQVFNPKVAETSNDPNAEINWMELMGVPSES